MYETMRFGCLTQKGNAIVLERPIPPIGAHDVLIEQLTCNICTTDYQQWMGLREHQGYPMVGGHEGAGRVVKTGEAVTTVKLGDLVAINSYLGCGYCEQCKMGHVSQCGNAPQYLTEDGYRGEFGFSTYSVWDEGTLLRMNPSLDPACAGFLEPLSTVVMGHRKLRLQPFETVLVIGAGTMGLLNALAARARGARVLITELMEKKLNAAREAGFEVIDAGKEDPVARVRELTDGKGADCAIVAVGNTAANTQAINSVRKIDGRILMFAAGYPVPQIEIDSNAVHYRRLEIIGTYGADNEDFIAAARMLNTGLIDVSPLIEPQRYPLTQIQEAFAAASRPGMYRVCVECQK